MTTIGDRLKKLREEKSKVDGVTLTKSYVAKQALEEDREYNYGNYEANKSKPPIDKIKRLAKFYGVTDEYILYGTDIRINTDSLEGIFANTKINFEGKLLSDYEKEFLLNTLKMLRKK